MGFCIISWSNCPTQRKDVEECWMYTLDPNRAVIVRYYLAEYDVKPTWTCYRWLAQLQIEPHGHGTW